MIEMSIVVLQCSMDLMKVELDPDGEPYPMSENGNHLIEVKQEKDPLLLTSETENEVSCISLSSVRHIPRKVTLAIKFMTCMVEVKLFLYLTKYHTMKTYPLLN